MGDRRAPGSDPPIRRRLGASNTESIAAEVVKAQRAETFLDFRRLVAIGVFTFVVGGLAVAVVRGSRQDLDAPSVAGRRRRVIALLVMLLVTAASRWRCQPSLIFS